MQAIVMRVKCTCGHDDCDVKVDDRVAVVLMAQNVNDGRAIGKIITDHSVDVVKDVRSYGPEPLNGIVEAFLHSAESIQNIERKIMDEKGNLLVSPEEAARILDVESAKMVARSIMSMMDDDETNPALVTTSEHVC